MVENGIRGVICHSINRYAKSDNRYMKDHDENNEPSYQKYWDINNLYSWEMLQKLPGNGLKWVEDLSDPSNYHFYVKGCKLKKLKNLLLICMIKMNILFT